MLKFFKKNKGFTLIELLVVIAIISVLASIVLVSLNTARIKGRDARKVADLKSLQIALELHYDGLGAGTYPAALSTLVTNGYIPAIPTDPKDNSAYKYAISTATHSLGVNKAYHLGAKLEGVSGDTGVLATDVDEGKTTDTSANWTGTYFDSTDCTGTYASGGTDVCYDITN